MEKMNLTREQKKLLKAMLKAAYNEGYQKGHKKGYAEGKVRAIDDGIYDCYDEVDEEETI